MDANSFALIRVHSRSKSLSTLTPNAKQGSFGEGTMMKRRKSDPPYVVCVNNAAWDDLTLRTIDRVMPRHTAALPLCAAETDGGVLYPGELKKFVADIKPGGLPAKVRVSWTSNKLRVYENADRAGQIQSGKEYDTSALPKDLFYRGRRHELGIGERRDHW